MGFAAYGVVGLLLRSGGHGAYGGTALPVAFAVNGLGFGYAYSPILSTVLRHVAPEHAPTPAACW